MRTDERRGSFAELETALSMVPAIKAAREHINRHSELPPALAAALKERGLFKLLLPKVFGGAELSLPCFIRCVEVIAQADGSAGWCVGQGGVFPNLADRMPPQTAREIWGANPGAVVATGTPFGSTAQPIGDGYQLSGKWRFASGCLHADWLAAMASIVDADGQVTGFGMFLVPRADVALGDGWNVSGLRGTGSREYTLDAHHVAAPRALLGAVLREHCGMATGLPAQLLFASAFGSVGLGIARRAIDSLMALAGGKMPVFTNRKLLDDDLVHAGLAEAEAEWGASRAFLHEMAEACTHQYANAGELPQIMRAHLRLAATHAMRKAGVVVDKVFTLAGSDAIFDDHPMHQCFQDIHALTQQIQARPAHFRTVGRVLLGLDPDSPVV